MEMCFLPHDKANKVNSFCDIGEKSLRAKQIVIPNKGDFAWAISGYLK